MVSQNNRDHLTCLTSDERKLQLMLPIRQHSSSDSTNTCEFKYQQQTSILLNCRFSVCRTICFKKDYRRTAITITTTAALIRQLDSALTESRIPDFAFPFTLRELCKGIRTKVMNGNLSWFVNLIY
uniref:Uncharacterized protein n=1 Tax=Glossina brevipalpis TaxID=37001 RepID=A0A1A9WXB7_9MUSC